MRRVVLRAVAAFALSLSLVAFPVLADDSKPSERPKAPDFSGYAYVTDVVGEVVKANDKSVTLRITWFAPVKSGVNRNNNNNRVRLGQNNRNFRNPFAPNMNRPTQPRVQMKEQHHDYELEYLEQSLVRTKTLPAKTDEKGKRANYTQKEIDEFRLPPGAPSYAANKFDLTPGTIVEVILVRDKTIPAAKATEDDLRIKYVTILGHDKNPPKDIANPKNNNNKKNNKNN